MDLYTLLSFALIATIFEISPGPNFFLISRSVSASGRNAALANIPGFGVAYLVHGTLSIYGVSAIVASAPSLLMSIQLLGAAYLMYLGMQSLLHCGRANTISFTGKVQTDTSLKTVESSSHLKIKLEKKLERRSRKKTIPGSSVSSESVLNVGVCKPSGRSVDGYNPYLKNFIDGLVTNILNPKSVLFYLAAVPQFTVVGESAAIPMILVIVHMLINAIWFGGVAHTLDRLLMKTQNINILLQKISAYALILLSGLFASGAVLSF